MAVTSFIPELWSARLLANLEGAHIATAFVNRDYEGEIKKCGDQVHVNFLGPVTVKDYTPNTDIDSPEALSTTKQTLVVDQFKYFNFQVDDVDKAQAAGTLMDRAMHNAAYGVADVVDKKIFATIAAAAPAANTIGTNASKISLTKDNIYDYIIALRTALNKKNAPAEGRAIAVPTDVYGLLLKDDRFVKTGSDNAETRLQTAHVGRAGGFEIYETENLPASTIIATVPMATTFAEQVTELEAYRPEARFADAVKGLDVYGVKTFYPDAVAKILFELG